MANKIAIDWNESELRIVAAQCNGIRVKVTDAAVIPIENSNVIETLRKAITERGLENSETLVGIGRGKAELRELQLPPVPDEELPDMVRFQAIRSFASAGDAAIVDFLVTNRTSDNVQMIAAAIGPPMMKEIRETCASAQLNMTRISIRPLASAALYLIHQQSKTSGDVVLIDLLSDDAEIVVTRQGRVIFVRTVRMPAIADSRGKALAGELRRSLAACGSSGSLESVVLWGRESVHAAEKEMLAEAAGSPVEVIDPFDYVDIESSTKSRLPKHVGRLAPLVGLLAADGSQSDRLVDFLNPRKRIIEEPNPYRNAMIAGIPILAAMLLAFLVYSQLKGKDEKIAELKDAYSAMKSDVDVAKQSVQRTEAIDKFLDGNVNWLHEIRRLAATMPDSDEMIVKSISGNANPRSGGGSLTIEGAVTNPSVIDDFEESLRDKTHVVVGDGASEQGAKGAYKWGVSESITISPEAIRNSRYEAIQALLAAESKNKTSQTSSMTSGNPPDESNPGEDDSDTALESSEIPQNPSPETTKDSKVQA